MAETSPDNYQFIPDDVSWDYTGDVNDYNAWMSQYNPQWENIASLKPNEQQLGNIPIAPGSSIYSWDGTGKSLADAAKEYTRRVGLAKAGKLPVQYNGRKSDINRFLSENGVENLEYAKSMGLDITALLQTYWKNVINARGGSGDPNRRGVWNAYSGQKMDYLAWLSQQPDLMKEGFNPWSEEYLKTINPDLFKLWSQEVERRHNNYYGDKYERKQMHDELRRQWIDTESRIPFQDLGDLSEDQQRMFTLVNNPAYGDYFTLAGEYETPWMKPFSKNELKYEPEDDEKDNDAYLKTLPGAATGIYQSLMRLGRRDIENRYKREFSNLQQKMKYHMGMGEASPLYLRAIRQLIDDRNNAMFNLRLNSGKAAVANALEVAKGSVDLWKTAQESANDNMKVMHGIMDKIRSGNREQAKHTFNEFKDRINLRVSKEKSKEIFNEWRAGNVKEAFEMITTAMRNNQEFMKVLSTLVLSSKLADATVLGKLTEEERSKWLEAAKFAQAFLGVSNYISGWGNNSLVREFLDVFNSNSGGQT
jgi:hypothetical protein